jgi:hypothetical protein
MMRKRPKMKISTTKIRQIIKEELQRVLTEQGDDDLPPGAGSTKYAVGRIPTKPRDLELDLDKTQEVDVAAALKREQEALADSQKAMTFREEAERLFNIFFADYDIDSLEIMTHNDPELEDIVAKLYGWNLNLFPHDVQPSPTIVKVAQDFEKEGKAILDNEGEFLDRVEKELYSAAKRKFAQSKEKPPAPARNVKVGQSAIPGTKQHAQLQDLFKSIDAKS